MPGYQFGQLTAVSEYRDFPGEPRYCPDARAMIRAALAGHPHAVGEAEIVVSELFSNGCRHTRSGDGGTLGVSVSALRTGLVVVSVADEGSALPIARGGTAAVPRLRPASRTSLGWRGLYLVNEATDDWGYDTNDSGGLTVWAVFESPFLASHTTD